MRTSGRLLPMVTSLLLALAACSDGGGDKAAPAAAPSTGPVDVTTTTEPAFGATGGERFCDLARVANERLNSLVQAGPSPDAARDLFTSAASAIRSMAEVAPTEIGPAARTMTGVYDDLLVALEKVDWDVERLPPETEQRLNAPEVRSAGDRLAVYQRDVCKIEA